MNQFTAMNQFNARQVSLLVIMLYLAHALPLYFFNVAMPAILRQQGMDLRWIGMLSLLYLPWAFKFFWAPLVDRYFIPRLGRRRSWLVLTQLAVIAGLLALAVMRIDYGLWPFVLTALWISTMAATQDIAIDGYAVDVYPATHYSLASTMQSIGIALGSMLGGAGTLWLYENYNWQMALLSLTGLIAMTTLSVCFLKESSDTRFLEKYKPSLRRVFSRPEIRRLLLVIVVYRLVESPAMAMLNPMLVDAKWSLTQIGLLFSVAGAAVGLLAAVAAGWLVKRQGSMRWLLGAGWLRSVIYMVVAIALLSGTIGFWGYAAAVVSILAVRYLAMTALYTYFMEHCSRQQAGTDFTVLVCFELLVFFLGAALSGFIAKALGYGNLFAVLSVVSIISVILSHMLMRPATVSTTYQTKT
ncbi:MFS transporter [Alkanindiges illinoisensis]|uniref:MFS transporter n=1 Tax=Alkanindiges illinoisensis TaxID=197183 RepID=UPI00047BED5D|nr:MFS transporter [Alkanindiges illinoisensis]